MALEILKIQSSQDGVTASVKIKLHSGAIYSGVIGLE